MGNFIFLQVLVVFALSITTSMINRRFLSLPAAIGVSAVAVFLLQWTTGILGNNEFVTINMEAIQSTVKSIKEDEYTLL